MRQGIKKQWDGGAKEVGDQEGSGITTYNLLKQIWALKQLHEFGPQTTKHKSYPLSQSSTTLASISGRMGMKG